VGPPRSTSPALAPGPQSTSPARPPAATGWCCEPYGYTSSGAYVPAESENYRLYLAGEFQATGSTGLTICGRLQSGDAAYLDWVGLFPIDEAACSFICEVTPPGATTCICGWVYRR
jgi:hypothetical protein